MTTSHVTIPDEFSIYKTGLECLRCLKTGSTTEANMGVINYSNKPSCGEECKSLVEFAVSKIAEKIDANMEIFFGIDSSFNVGVGAEIKTGVILSLAFEAFKPNVKFEAKAVSEFKASIGVGATTKLFGITFCKTKKRSHTLLAFGRTSLSFKLKFKVSAGLGAGIEASGEAIAGDELGAEICAGAFIGTGAEVSISVSAGIETKIYSNE